MDEKKSVILKLPTAATIGKYVRNTVACLVVALTILGGLLYAKVQHETAVASYAAKQATDQALRAAAAAAQGTSVSLCTSLNALAALQPPAGSATTNPSRAYEQQEHKILAGLSVDLKCPR